jgi:histidinol phosphatase-like PHP family hydrolase
MTFDNIMAEATKLGIDVVAITDHLMRPKDIANLRKTGRLIREFRDKNSVDNIIFGVEVCEIDHNGKTLLTKELIDDLGIELVIGGVHETHLGPGIETNHIANRQFVHQSMMMVNPLIEILVHPWWLDKAEFERKHFPWPEDMSFIPIQRTKDLANASKRYGTYIEISTMSGLCNADVSESFRAGYLDYYKLLYEHGALFALGSDAHELSEMRSYDFARRMVAEIGIDENRLYKPKKLR